MTTPGEDSVVAHAQEFPVVEARLRAAGGESPLTQGRATSAPTVGGDHADGGCESAAPIPTARDHVGEGAGDGTPPIDTPSPAQSIPDDVMATVDRIWDEGFGPDDQGAKAAIPTQMRLFCKVSMVHAIMAERERCAKIIVLYSDHPNEVVSFVADEIYVAIRDGWKP